MRAQGGGTIINLSSLASFDPFPGLSVYGACKAWVNLFTRGIANEGRPHNIRAFSVALGAVETRLLRGLFQDYPADKTLTPEEVADLVFTLTSPTFRHSSGQTLQVNR
jgi:NAD(P)-dependent dehydrogenase (short-subunit alcohol dehydrogenase family)